MADHHTSDGSERPNLMTRDEFIKRILHSGEITRVAQHLALVIFLVSEGRNQLSLSIHDLVKITGWGRTAIKEHLDELEIFMRVTFGGGRAKTLFELQGVVEDALATAVVAASRPPDPTVSRPPPVSRPAIVPVVAGWRPPQAMAGRDVATSLAAAVAVSLAATPVSAASRPPETPISSVVATSRPSEGRQTAANAVVAASRPPEGREAVPSTVTERERESNTVKNNLSLSTTPHAREEAAEEVDPIRLNGVAIYGPDFKLSYASIDQAALLIGMPKERARAIAEIHARDWAMNGNKPDRPMSMITRILKNDFNEGQVQEIKIEKAKAVSANKPAESRAERMLRHVEAKTEKGHR